MNSINTDTTTTADTVDTIDTLGAVNIDIDPSDPMGLTARSSRGFTDDPLVAELSQSAPEVGNETAFDAFEGVDADDPNFAEVTNDDDQQPEADPSEPEPEEVKIPKVEFSAFKLSAMGLVDTIDSLAQGFLPNRSKSSFFASREELQRAKLLSRQRNGKDLTTDELDLVHNYEQWQDYCDSIPMSSATKESIVQPLAEVLAKRSAVITPEARLAIAMGGYALPLVVPLLSRRKRGL